MPQPKIDTVIAEMRALGELTRVYADHSRDGFDRVENSLNGMRDQVKDLSVKVGIQNGSVTTLKEAEREHREIINNIKSIHINCPAPAIGDSLREHITSSLARVEKERNNPVRWLIDNWKPVVVVFVCSIVLYKTVPSLAVNLWGWVSGIAIDIGL